MSEQGSGRLFGRRRRANAGPAAKRTERYTVTANEAESAALEAKAKDAGMTVPRLLFESAMSAHVETSTERKAAIAELFALQRTVANIANNVNQLARFANTESRFPGEAEAVVDEYRQLVPSIRAAIDRLADS